MTLFSITILAYIIFLFPVILHPSIILDYLHRSVDQFKLRNFLEQVAGITSFTNIQTICIVCVASYTTLTGQRLPSIFKYLTAILVFLCVMRAWLWSERLALIELCLPVIVIRFALIRDKRRMWLILAPFLGIIGLFILFSFAEYFRSWQSAKTGSEHDFVDYMLVRFSAYYATALDNGAALIKYKEPFYYPAMTAVWFNKLPLWSLVDMDLPDLNFENFLMNYGNPEYNNMSGLYAPFADYGTVMGALCWGILGLFTGWLTRQYYRRSLLGIVFYPLWFTGVLEILRIFYWGDARFFVTLLTTAVLLTYLKPRTTDTAPYSR